MPATHAQRLAQHILEAQARIAPDDPVLHDVERLVLDTVGCGLGAAQAAPVKAARQWAGMNKAAPHAHILGTKDVSSIVGATLANGTATRHLDMNDCDWMRDPAHPSDNIAGCLAVAEGMGTSSRELLAAILTAYEVQMRSCEFTKVSFFKETGWDHTTFITIASACAAGVLLKLDVTRLAHAIAIAGCYPTVGQLRVGQISTMKAMSAGLAATRGIEAAFLASFGGTGPLDIFEGKRGMGKLMLGECDWELFSAPVGQWRLPRTCFKQYPAAYIIHAGIDAALSLKREHPFDASDVAAVEVAGFGWLIEDMVNGMGGKSRYDIDARETADHSLPYCVAVALVDGEYTIRQLDTPRWRDDDVKRMLGKVRCVHDAALDGGFPARRPVRVGVTLQDGARYIKEVEFPRGDPRHPLSDGDLAMKFCSLAEAVLPRSRTDRAIEVALNLRRYSVSDLLEACAA